MDQTNRQPLDEEVTFRPMGLEDIEQVVVIEEEAFATPWTENAFRNELTQNHFAHYIVMEADGFVAGYAGMWLIMDEAHITNVAVRSDFRGKKLGERLMRELIAVSKLKGVHKMTLEVRVSNHVARGMYEKFGFKDVGVRRGYYSDNNEDAIIMWADFS